jgi:exonuclease SbcC
MILSNFIKPKWQHSNPNIRRSVIDGLDDTAILHEIAQNDTAAEVRQAALKKINDLNILDAIAHNDSDKNVQAVAQQRIKQLLCSESLSLEQRIAWINKTNDAEQIAEVAVNAPEVELRLAAIAKLEREGLLGDIVINDPVSEVRLTVLEKLTQKSTLERVVKATRNIDKRLYRRAREKLDEVIEQIERPARVYAEYEAICTKLNALDKRLNSGMSFLEMTTKNAKLLKTQQLEFNNLQTTWQTIAEYAESECQSRYTELEQKVKLAFEKYEQALKAIEAREEALAPIRESKQTVCTKLEALLIDLKKHQSLDNQAHEDFTDKFTALETEWNYIPTVDDSDEESNSQARFKRIAESIQKRHKNLRDIYEATEKLEALCTETDKLLNSKTTVTTEQLSKFKARWQKVSLPESPVELDSRFKKNMTALEQRLQAQHEKRKQTVNKLKTLLNELEGTLEKGELKTAISLDEKATKLLKTIKDKSNRAVLDKRLQQCKLKINDLRSWQSWGGKVERDNLCQKISNLLETEETPEKQLEMVLQAQEAWKKLGSNGYSQELWKQFNDNCQQIYRKYREDLCQQVEELEKTSADKPEESAKVIHNYQQTWKNLGSQGNSDEVWKRFNQACQTAYEPCKVYFHEKSNEREQHLLQKQALSEQLETYAENTNWQTVEWKKVSNLVRDAENKWKTIGATDRKFKKSIQQRFESALLVLETHLDNERLRNCHERVQLYLQVVGIVEDFETFIATNSDAKLIESTLNQAIENLKALQTQWKVTIPGSRRIEREFWTSFRGSCDKLFNYRQKQIDEQSNELQAYLDQKTAICDEMDRMLKDDSINSDQIKKFRDQWQDIKADWKQIGNIARRRKAKAIETVEKRFETLYKKLRNQYKKQLANEQRDQLDQLKLKAALCAEVEQATEFDETIQNRWQELAPLHNSEFEQIIQQRFEKACNNAEDIVNPKGIEEKQAYCIRMEILAGIESPAEAAQARLAYQVDRLSAAMTDGNKTSMNPEQEALEIQQNWYLSSAVSRKQTQILEQRFNKACQALQ